MAETITLAMAAISALVLAAPYVPAVARWLLAQSQQQPKTLVNPIDNSVVVPRPVTPEVIDHAREVAQDFRALEQLEARKPERNAAFAAGIKAVRANFLSEPEAAS